MCLGFDGVRIEGAADPFGQLGVALMLRVGDRLEEVGVAPGPAAILGRAAPDRFDQVRVFNAWLGVEGNPPLRAADHLARFRLLGALRARLLGEGRNLGVRLGFDDVGIEVIGDPFFEFGVALVFGVVDASRSSA